MAKKLSKSDVKNKSPFSFGNKTKENKEVKSGVVVEFANGKTKTFLTPAGKGTKYSAELAMNVKITNDGLFKTKNGIEIPLTSEERAYRGGYLDAQKDASKAYNATKSKKSSGGAK